MSGAAVGTARARPMTGNVCTSYDAAMEMAAPTLDQIRAARERLRELVAETPLWRWRGDAIEQAVGRGTEVLLKLELFQHAGSFKPRGALCAMMDLAPDALRRGVTAVSAGNHAMAVGYAARALGTSAKVVMPRTANPARVQGCREYGTEVELVDDVHRAFTRVREIEDREGRAFIHPFEGPLIALGTATMGMEICQQAGDLDAVIVPIGGGGLCAGVASAVKQLLPRCAGYGVEPAGADSMHRSFASGKPESIDAVRTIADSLGAPHAAPYSFALCRRYVDRLVKVDDDALPSAMALLFRSAKLAVEPAGAPPPPPLCGPPRATPPRQRVALVVCGAHIDASTLPQPPRLGY